MIRAVIVDDEPQARRRVRELLSTESDVEVVAEYGRGSTALPDLSVLKPDVVFLDVEMPEMSGLELMASLRQSALRVSIVLVTAFDRYAVQAFEQHAVDYLLKPFDEERFAKTVERIRECVNIAAAAPNDDRTNRYLTRLAVKNGGRIQFVRIPEIDWLASEGNYVRLHTGKDSHLFRGTIAWFERQLDPTQFVRINRSMIVNWIESPSSNPPSIAIMSFRCAMGRAFACLLPTDDGCRR